MPAGMRKASVSVRPEDVHLGQPGDGAIAGTVTFVRDLGGTIETFVDVRRHDRSSRSRRRASGPTSRAGDKVGVVLPPEGCVVLKS